ncbi:Cache, type 2 domain protein [Syntrophobacter sp. SbD1]|nr:Cache, type 2 domain protein [Syntrophobacter sp. SbD1]
MRKTFAFLSCFLFLSLLYTSWIMAQDHATKEECVAKCKEAAALIKDIGLEAALPKLQDPKGQFVWKDSYVYVQDLEGKMLAHPMVPALVGKNSSGLKDVNGFNFTAAIVTLANEKGEGWIEYMWPKPGEKTPSQKVAFVYRVPGEKIIVCAGIYE